MSFWDDTRESVNERTATGDISTELFKTIIGFGLDPIMLVQPTFYMGRSYILCYDYMDYVEKLLKCEPGEKNTFQYLLYLRETIAVFGRCVKNAVGPIEEVLSAMDDILEKKIRELGDIDDSEPEELCGLADSSDDEEDDEFKTERESMASELQAKLKMSNLSDKISYELSLRLAAMYECCVFYVGLFKELTSADIAGETVMLMEICVEIQHILDTKMRHLLLEDVFLENASSFKTGLNPWISHALGELINNINRSGRQ